MRILLFLLAALPLLAEDGPGPYPWEMPQEKQLILDQIRLTRVSVAAKDASLAVALGFVKEKLGLDVDLSAAGKAAEKKVTVEAADLDADSALHLVLDPLGLSWTAEPGKLFVAPPDKLPAGSPAEEVLTAIQTLKLAGHGEEAEDVETAALRRRLLDLPLVQEFKDKPLSEVLQFIAGYSRFTLVVEPTVSGSAKLAEKSTVSLQTQRTWDALDQLLAPRGLGFWLGVVEPTVSGGAKLAAVHVDAKEAAAARNAEADAARNQAKELLDKELPVEAQGVTLQAYAAEIEKMTGLKVAMDPPTWAAAPIITIPKKTAKLRDILGDVASQSAGAWYIWKGRVYFVR